MMHCDEWVCLLIQNYLSFISLCPDPSLVGILTLVFPMICFPLIPTTCVIFSPMHSFSRVLSLFPIVPSSHLLCAFHVTFSLISLDCFELITLTHLMTLHRLSPLPSTLECLRHVLAHTTLSSTLSKTECSSLLL